MLSREKLVFIFFALAFGLAVNLHVPDLGETYVSRNLFLWSFMALLLPVLWWHPLRRGALRWQPIWLIGLGGPIIGAVLVLWVNIIGGFANFNLGHYFLPGMLLIWGLLVLGLLQFDVTPRQWAVVLIAIMLALLPQYVLHLIATNPVIFLPVSIELHQIFVKEYAGFGQYNLYGSFLVSLLLLAIWAIGRLDGAPKHRFALLALLFVFGLDAPSLASKTSLLGLAAGLICLAAHVYGHRADRDLVRHSSIAVAVLLLACLIGALALYLADGVVGRSTRWSMDENSVQTRYAMWVIAWRGFLEAPLFGHGLAGYTALYTEHFARYGLAEGLSFYPTVSLPHNLVMHVLSETGLFGALVLLGPLVWLGVHILRTHPGRFAIIGLCAPVLIHTQLEYPYIASGGHYFILALALVAGLSFTGDERARAGPVLARRLPLSGDTIIAARAGFAALLLLSTTAVGSAGVMQYTVYRAAKSFAGHVTLPLEPYMVARYAQADVSHPIVGERMLAMSDLVLARKALEAKRYDIIRELVIPALDNHILPVYNNWGVWEIAMRCYFETGQVDRAYAMAHRVGKFDPERAANYIRIIDNSVAQLEQQTNRPQQ